MWGECHGLKNTFWCLAEILPFSRKDLKRLHRFAGLTWQIVCCEPYFSVVFSQLCKSVSPPELTCVNSHTLSTGLRMQPLPCARGSPEGGHRSHHGKCWDELREAPSGTSVVSLPACFWFLVVTNWKIQTARPTAPAHVLVLYNF